MATTDTTKDELSSFRVSMLEELGFSKDEANRLADSYYAQTIKGKKGSPDRTYLLRVDHHYVRRMLDGGATKEQVLAIIL